MGQGSNKAMGKSSIFSGSGSKQGLSKKLGVTFYGEKDMSYPGGVPGPGKVTDPDPKAKPPAGSKAALNTAFDNLSDEDFKVDSPIDSDAITSIPGQSQTGIGSTNQVKITGSDGNKDVNKIITKYNTNTTGKTSWGQKSDNKNPNLHPTSTGNFFQSGRGQKKVETINNLANAGSLKSAKTILSTYQADTSNFNKSGYGGDGSDISVTSKQPKPTTSIVGVKKKKK